MRPRHLVRALRAIGENARPAAPELADLFNRGLLTDFVPMMLINADRELAETTFVHALTNQSIRVRENALDDLFPNPGPTNALVELAGLINCLNDETPGSNGFGGVSTAVMLRFHAANILGGGGGAIDSKRTVQALIERLQREKERLVRTAIIGSLGKLGGNAKSALPALRQATNDPDHYVAEQAVKSLKAIESASP